jgi:hypothetical protein
MKDGRRYIFGAIYYEIKVILTAVALCCFLAVGAILIFGNVRAIAESPGKKMSISTMASSYILHRMPYLLEQLRGDARSNEKLKPIIERVKLHAPEESLRKQYPNAYAYPGEDVNLIIVEADFLKSVILDSSVGALYATGWGIADTYFDKACGAYHSAYKTYRNKPFSQPPSDYFDFTAYLGKDTYFNAFYINMNFLLMDDTLMWSFLHEVGHLALKHRTKDKLAYAESRRREEAADQWASSTMKELGYSLFGIAYQLYGQARVESCLKPLGLITPETESTHPSFTRRYSSMKKEFDVTQSPKTRGYSTFYTSFPWNRGIIQNVWITVYNKESTFRHRVQVTTQKVPGNTYHFSKGICEWVNNTLHIYFRMPGKDKRIEYIIPDVSRVYNVMNARVYEAQNNLSDEGNYACFQLNPFFEHVKLAGDSTVAEQRRELESTEFLARHLRKVGTEETLIEKILNSFAEKERAEKTILLAYGKGQISYASCNERLTTVYKKYERDCDSYLGKERHRLFVESIESDSSVRFADQILTSSQKDLKQLGNGIFEKGFGYKPQK